MKGSASQQYMRIAKQKCFGFAGTVTGLNQRPTILSRGSGVKVAVLPGFNKSIRPGGELKIPAGL
jgi:hypothetical protein